jgi:copper chaperone
MNTLLFKTNIHCGNCLRSVGPFLDELEEIAEWSVDLQHPDRLLTVVAQGSLLPDQIVATVEEAGFDAAPV